MYCRLRTAQMSSYSRQSSPFSLSQHLTSTSLSFLHTTTLPNSVHIIYIWNICWYVLLTSFMSVESCRLATSCRDYRRWFEMCLRLTCAAPELYVTLSEIVDLLQVHLLLQKLQCTATTAASNIIRKYNKHYLFFNLTKALLEWHAHL